MVIAEEVNARIVVYIIRQDERLTRIENSVAMLTNFLTTVTAQINALTDRATTKYGVSEPFQEPAHIETCEDLNIEAVVVIEDAEIVRMKESVVQADQDVDHTEKEISKVEHIDFLLPYHVLESKATTSFVLVSILFPDVVFKTNGSHQFCWPISHALWFIILRYFKTRGRVFFKGEENDAGQRRRVWLEYYYNRFWKPSIN